MDIFDDELGCNEVRDVFSATISTPKFVSGIWNVSLVQSSWLDLDVEEEGQAA